MHSCKWRRLRDRFGPTAAVGNARERLSACSRWALHSGRSGFGQNEPRDERNVSTVFDTSGFVI